MLWRWLWAVDELRRTDETMTAERRSATMLVAVGRALHADPDGRNCYPAQSTLARFAGTKRDTVRDIDRWLVEVGAMVLTKDAGRRTTKYYRLLLPPLSGSLEDHLNDGEMALQGTTQRNQDGPLDGPLEDHNLPLRRRRVANPPPGGCAPLHPVHRGNDSSSPRSFRRSAESSPDTSA